MEKRTVKSVAEAVVALELIGKSRQQYIYEQWIQDWSNQISMEEFFRMVGRYESEIYFPDLMAEAAENKRKGK